MEERQYERASSTWLSYESVQRRGIRKGGGPTGEGRSKLSKSRMMIENFKESTRANDKHYTTERNGQKKGRKSLKIVTLPTSLLSPLWLFVMLFAAPTVDRLLHGLETRLLVCKGPAVISDHDLVRIKCSS